ncbi:MAG: sulfite exporter TauE/SafE family protein [Prevotella sp.]|nr:sulfite exporter TauE/SafE family protein [Prevotella sp.]
MEWLQALLDNSSTPVLTAFILGLLTAISPCPLATNIAAIGYIGKDMESRRHVFLNGLLYTAGRIVAYTVLGLLLILIIRQGASMFGIQKFIGTWGEMLLGPALILIGLLMLFCDKLNLPQFGFNGSHADGLKRRGGWGAFLLGVLFAMAFCPTSGMFYFGMLIPMSATATMGYLLPAVFAIATALPVLVVAWLLAFSMQKVGKFYGWLKGIERWATIIVGVLFILIGLYECYIIYL